jgi:hypothetical protein
VVNGDRMREVGDGGGGRDNRMPRAVRGRQGLEGTDVDGDKPSGVDANESRSAGGEGRAARQDERDQENPSHRARERCKPASQSKVWCPRAPHRCEAQLRHHRTDMVLSGCCCELSIGHST